MRVLLFKGWCLLNADWLLQTLRLWNCTQGPKTALQISFYCCESWWNGLTWSTDNSEYEELLTNGACESSCQGCGHCCQVGWASAAIWTSGVSCTYQGAPSAHYWPQKQQVGQVIFAWDTFGNTRRPSWQQSQYTQSSRQATWSLVASGTLLQISLTHQKRYSADLSRWESVHGLPRPGERRQRWRPSSLTVCCSTDVSDGSLQFYVD